MLGINPCLYMQFKHFDYHQEMGFKQGTKVYLWLYIYLENFFLLDNILVNT